MSRNVRSGWKSNADPSLLDRVAIESQSESFVTGYAYIRTSAGTVHGDYLCTMRS